MSLGWRPIIGFGVLALVLVAGGIVFLNSSLPRLALNGVEGTGRVDSDLTLVRTDSSSYHRAWVVYIDLEGVEHRQYIRIPSGAQTGSEIFVLFDPDNPETVDWRPRGDHLGFTILMPASILLLIGGFVFARNRQRHRQAATDQSM